MVRLFKAGVMIAWKIQGAGGSIILGERGEGNGKFRKGPSCSCWDMNGSR